MVCQDYTQMTKIVEEVLPQKRVFPYPFKNNNPLTAGVRELLFVTVLGGSWRILHARQEKPWRFHRLLAEYQSILSIHRSVPTVLQRTLLMLFSVLLSVYIR